MHRSVYERFDMDEVPDFDAMRQYRPVTLANHLDFKDAYENSVGKSNPQPASAAAYIVTKLLPDQ